MFSALRFLMLDEAPEPQFCQRDSYSQGLNSNPLFPDFRMPWNHRTPDLGFHTIPAKLIESQKTKLGMASNRMKLSNVETITIFRASQSWEFAILSNYHAKKAACWWAPQMQTYANTPFQWSASKKRVPLTAIWRKGLTPWQLAKQEKHSKQLNGTGASAA